MSPALLGKLVSGQCAASARLPWAIFEELVVITFPSPSSRLRRTEIYGSIAGRAG
ncbi:hypothetical protein [Streptomyces sp. NPDC012825]|uniref:hypothetical protein n=1 Tax=Streptomyces sp. NPDC012825 TaxID=3364851 RepID=UPI0036B62F16